MNTEFFCLLHSLHKTFREFHFLSFQKAYFHLVVKVFPCGHVAGSTFEVTLSNVSCCFWILKSPTRAPHQIPAFCPAPFLSRSLCVLNSQSTLVSRIAIPPPTHVFLSSSWNVHPILVYLGNSSITFLTKFFLIS